MKHKACICKHVKFDELWGEYKCLTRQIRLYSDGEDFLNCSACPLYESSKVCVTKRRNKSNKKC